MNSGKITRLQITPFILVRNRKREKEKKEEALQKAGETEVFFVQANPDAYSIAYNLQYKIKQKTHRLDNRKAILMP